MKKLDKVLADRITSKGHISLVEFMRESLTHPKFGFYMKKDIFGARGNFVTSPEISQMFGELIGIWCLKLWEKMNKPNNFQIIEMGPGLGTLMKDLLRVCDKLSSDFLRATKISLLRPASISIFSPGLAFFFKISALSFMPKFWRNCPCGIRLYTLAPDCFAILEINSKSTCAVKSDSPGLSKALQNLCFFYGLQCFSERNLCMTVVDDKTIP